MTTESSIEIYKKFFIASNGGNPLRIEDLYRAILKANPNFGGSAEDIRDMFLELDSNRDMTISLEEFLRALTAEKATKEDMSKQFNALDKNKNGKIDKKELLCLVQKSNVKVSEKRLNDIFEKVDHNKDGEIDYEEFMQECFLD